MCMDASTIRKTVSTNHQWLHNRRQNRLSPRQYLLLFRPPHHPRRLSMLLSMTVTVTEDVVASAAVIGSRDQKRRLLQCLHPHQRPWRPSRHPLLSSRPGSLLWCLQDVAASAAVIGSRDQKRRLLQCLHPHQCL